MKTQIIILLILTTFLFFGCTENQDNLVDTNTDNKYEDTNTDNNYEDTNTNEKQEKVDLTLEEAFSIAKTDKDYNDFSAPKVAGNFSPNKVKRFSLEAQDINNNSIDIFEGSFDSNFYITVSTKYTAENLFLTFLDLNNNEIQFNTYLGEVLVSTEGIVSSNKTKTIYEIQPLHDLNEGTYKITGDINEPCLICSRETIIYSEGYSFSGKDLTQSLSIPDNNFVLIILMVCVIAFILPRKRIYS